MNTSKMALRRFTLRAAGGYRGREGDERFVRELLDSFGSSWPADADEAADGVTFDHSFPVVEDGQRTARTVLVYWRERRVVVDVVDRQMMLDLAWRELLRACLQMDAEPQYVLLTNQRDFHLYDLARDRNEPRLTISLDEIPKYSEAFPFFRPDWVPGTTPKIINVDKVSKEVAELVGRVYRALRQSNPGRDQDVVRFTLQCIVAMFAEDIGLLPKQHFTTLLYEGAEVGDAGDRLGELFAAMSTKDRPADEIPYFNGGLFTDSISLELGRGPLRALTKASEADWTFVDPHIFGSVFQGIMTDAERHASGAHYTAREDIMSVVGPTVIEPWRRRIDSASTLSELQSVVKGLASYRVLDPACGSGNFLYVAFRELYKLETEVLRRMYEFSSMQKGKRKATWISGIRTTNFFGIDNNPFAVELAKTTLNIAKKIAFEERKAMVVELYEQGFLDVDPSLPLDNLDANILCGDALFADWPLVDAIVGNPPILGDRKLREELGKDYIVRLKEHSGLSGLVNLCCYWFRRAHDHLAPGARAGMVATSGIRVGKAREAALDYIARNGGTITDAISSQPWPGEAALDVSIINWIKGPASPPFRLQIDGRVHLRPEIPTHLRLHVDLASAEGLMANASGTTMGAILGHEGFKAPMALCGTPRSWLRPMATGTAVLQGSAVTSPDYCIFLADAATEAEARALGGAGFARLKEVVKPSIEQNAADGKKTQHYERWLQRWWQPLDPRRDFFQAMSRRQRCIACSNPQARPIFVFLSTAFVPTNTLQVFTYDDDYSFGILQSTLHWEWTKAKGGRVTERIRYTSAVWKTFPWPQEPSEEEVVAVSTAARSLRYTRRQLMVENGWSLRALYQAAEVAGPHPLQDAQAKLDEAVENAYGKPADQVATEFLLEMNLHLAEDEKAGQLIQGPGLPRGLAPGDPRWLSDDCVAPPSLFAVAGQAGEARDG